MKDKKNSLMGGVAILSVAGLISKVFGMFFRIPLGNMIGSEGMGIYQAVYTTYTLLLTISTAGIPVAISRLVSESVTLGKPKQARSILRLSLLMLTLLGALLAPLLIIFAGPLATRTGDPEAAMGYIAIAPSILTVSVISAFRGYMQGRSRMIPTAISQLIEQLAKVVLSFPLAYFGLRYYGVAYAAAGALLGITIGECMALLYMFIVYMRGRRGFIEQEALDNSAPVPRKDLARQIIQIAIPVTIGSMIVPAAGFIDSTMVRLRLIVGGFAMEEARSLYGLLTGYAIPLVNVPTVLAIAVCIGLVPSISSARIEGRLDEMRETSAQGLRLASLISFPCTVGMWLLASQIMNLLYPALPADELQIGGQILSISAWTIILFTHVQATSGILQGAGMQKVPTYSLAAGVALKIVLNYVLVAIPSINVFGAPVASIVCYAVSMLINLACIICSTGMRFDWSGIVVRPGLATAGMGGALFLMIQLLDMERKRNAILAIAVAVVVYAVLAIVFGALRRDDLLQVSGGAKIERLLVKLRLWRPREE